MCHGLVVLDQSKVAGVVGLNQTTPGRGRLGMAGGRQEQETEQGRRDWQSGFQRRRPKLKRIRKESGTEEGIRV